MTAEDAAEVAETLARDFGVILQPEERERLTKLHRRRYNAAPGDEHWVLSSRQRPVSALWGLKSSGGRASVNARSESIADGHYPHAVVSQGRCALIVSGFYEWGGSPRGPWHIAAANKGLLALATIARRDAEGRARFAVVTRPAVPPVEALHDRMPVILERAALAQWLDADSPVGAALELLDADEAATLNARRVSARVNNPRHDDVACLAADPQGVLF